MNLVQLVFSFGAIVLLALIARWLFPVRRPLDAERVTRNFRRCYPDLNAGTPIIDDAGQTALVPVNGQSDVGLIRQFGDRIVCRLIAPGDLAGLDARADRLKLEFGDFTQPAAILILSGDAQESAAKILKPLEKRSNTHAPASA